MNVNQEKCHENGTQGHFKKYGSLFRDYEIHDI